MMYKKIQNFYDNIHYNDISYELKSVNNNLLITFIKCTLLGATCGDGKGGFDIET